MLSCLVLKVLFLPDGSCFPPATDEASNHPRSHLLGFSAALAPKFHSFRCSLASRPCDQQADTGHFSTNRWKRKKRQGRKKKRKESPIGPPETVHKHDFFYIRALSGSHDKVEAKKK